MISAKNMLVFYLLPLFFSEGYEVRNISQLQKESSMFCLKYRQYGCFVPDRDFAAAINAENTIGYLDFVSDGLRG